MLVKISNEKEIALEDIVCITAYDERNMDFINKNKANIYSLCDNPKSIVVVCRQEEYIVYLCPLNAGSIKKRQISLS